MNGPNRPRVDYVDWLRIGAVLLLIYFHSARIFDNFEPFYAKSRQTSVALDALIEFLNVWHMKLFFLLSGAGTFFALGFRSGKQYAWERFKRIFIPFIFGCLVIVPPQGYYTLLPHPEFHHNYLQYLPVYFKINPKTAGGYRGTFEWGHLWFLLYLFTYSMLALPLFLFLKKGGQKLFAKLSTLAEKPGLIFLPIILLGVFETALRPFWPGSNNFYSDWANHTNYFFYFIAGYLVVADERFVKAVDRRLKVIVPIAVALMLMHLAVEKFGPEKQQVPLAAILTYIFIYAGICWLWVIMILALGRRFLNFNRPILNYLIPAALPFYILHQTVIVILGYYVLQTGFRLPLEYALITTASIIACLLIYDLLIKRFNPVRVLFGMKPKKTVVSG